MPRAWNKFKDKLSHRPATPPVTSARPTASPSTIPPTDKSDDIPVNTQDALTTVTEPQTVPDEQQKQQQQIKNAIWNAAYEKLYEEEEDLVKAYEKTIRKLRELHNASTPTDAVSADGKPERWQTIQDGIRIGLERTEKEAKIKRQMGEVIRLTESVGGLISKATKHSPEASLVWSGFCLTAEIIANPIHESAAQRDGLKYIASKMEWYWHLTDILFQAEPSASQHIGLEGKLKDGIISLYKKCLSFQLRSVRVYHQNRVLTALGDFVKYDDWADQLQSIKSEELKVETMCQQFNESHFKKSLQLIPESINNFLDAFQDWSEKKEDEECRALVAKSVPSITKQSIMERKGELFTTCCDWFFESKSFQAWRTSSSQNILLVSGGPGRGKTMLLCALIEWLQDYRGLTYFFCVATDSSVNSQIAILQGLIYAIILKVPELLKYVRQNKDGLKLSEDNLEIALFNTLKAMLMDPLMSDGIIVIDALDECQGGINRILKLVHMTSSSNAKWILSCRPQETKVEAELTANHTGFLHLSLDDELPSSAVQEFIHRELDHFGSLWADEEPEPATINQIKSELVEKAGGTYLWVSLVLSDIRRELERTEIFTSVLNFVEKRVREKPVSLVAMYDAMMKQVNDDHDSSFYKDILKLVFVVFRPLTLREIQHLSKKREIRDIRSMDRLRRLILQRGSFLSYSAELGTISFVHQSAKDFISERGYDDDVGVLNEIPQLGHVDLFNRSVRVMSELLHKDMYNLQHPGRELEDVEPPDPNPLDQMAYSCLNWLEHLMHAAPTYLDYVDLSDCAQLAMQFFSSHSLYWLEALSLLGHLSEGIRMMQSLRNTIDHCEVEELRPWVNDIHAFLLKFRQVAEVYPLQLYASGLIFAPSCSLLKQARHLSDGPQWISSVSGIPSDWDSNVLNIEVGHGVIGAQCFWGSNHSLCIVVPQGDGCLDVAIYDAEIGAMVRSKRTSTSFHHLIQPQICSNKQMLAWRDSTGDKLNILNIDHEDLQQISLDDPGESPLSLAFSKNARYLISWSKTSSQVQVWDTVDESNNYAFSKTKGEDMFCFLDATTILSALDDTIYFTGMDGEKHKTVRLESKIIDDIKTFSANDTRFLTFAVDTVDVNSTWTAQLWNANRGECIWAFPIKSKSIAMVGRLITSSDGYMCALFAHGSSGTNKSETWTVPGPKQIGDDQDSITLRTIDAEENTTVTSVASQEFDHLWCFSSSGQYLFTSSTISNRLAVIDASRGVICRVFNFVRGEIVSMAPCPYGRYLAVTVWFDSVYSTKIWSLFDELGSHEVHDAPERISNLVFRPSERKQSRFIENAIDGSLGSWDTDTSLYTFWGTIQTLVDHELSHFWHGPNITISYSGQMVAIYGLERNLEIWEERNGAKHIKIHSHQHVVDVQSTAFSKDGTILAALQLGMPAIILIYLDTDSSVVMPIGNREYLSAITFLSGDDSIAITGFDLISIYDLKGVLIGATSYDGEIIQALESAVLGDEELLVSADRFHLRIWNVTDPTSITLAHQLNMDNSAIDRILHRSAKPFTFYTNLGILDLSPTFNAETLDNISIHSFMVGFGLADDDSWVAKDGKRVLWLPPGNRPSRQREIVVTESSVAIGRGYGALTILNFDLDRSVLAELTGLGGEAGVGETAESDAQNKES